MRNTVIDFLNLSRHRMPGRQPKPIRKRKHMMLAEMYGNVHIGLAFGGASIGLGIATAGGVVAMSRNPGMFGRILMIMLLGMALAEGWAVIAWIVVKKSGL
jgi:F-type H+-transporting ATPase subunit c